MRQKHNFAIILVHEINFIKLSRHKSNFFENFNMILKILFELNHYK